VADLDIFDMLVQAHRYSTMFEHLDFSDFLADRHRLHAPAVTAFLKKLEVSFNNKNLFGN
jgi:hypothetical protein